MVYGVQMSICAAMHTCMHSLAFLLEETARKILPEAVLACCVSGIIHVRCGYYRWGSRDAIRYSDIDAASVCIGRYEAYELPIKEKVPASLRAPRKILDRE